MKLRLSLLVTALVLLFAPLTQAQTQECNSTIIDQGGFIHNPQIIGSAARTLINQGADVKVVIVGSISRYGSNLTDVERAFEANCSSWTTNGQRKANLFVVMVAPNDRAKNIFLGSYYNGAFDITSTYSQLSNTYFKNRQWELGIAAVLTGTTGQAVSFRQQRVAQQQQQSRTYTAPTYSQNTAPTQQADSGPSGFVIFLLVLLVFAVIVGILYVIHRATRTTETETTDYTPTPDRTSTPNPYRSRSYAAAASAAPAPVSHTTIINNPGNSGDGLLTGIVVGEMLSRPNNPTVVYEQPSTPTYVEPTPSYVPSEPVPSSAPDSTWEEPTQSAPDTSFTPEPESTPSYDSPSSDSSFGGDSGGSSDSSFGGDSGGGSSDSGF